VAGGDEPGAEFDSAPRAGRRRAEVAPGGLSVADLLARHGLDPRPAESGTRHRLRERSDDWDSDDPDLRSSSDTGEPPDDGEGYVERFDDGRGVDQDDATDRLFPATVFAAPGEPRDPPAPAERGDVAVDDRPTDVVPKLARIPIARLELPPWPSASRINLDDEHDALADQLPVEEDREAPIRDSPAVRDDPARWDGPTRSHGPARRNGPARRDEPASQDEPVRRDQPPSREEPVRRDESASREGPARQDEREDRTGEVRGVELRAQRIDESLIRLTAIHAGLGRELTERISSGGSTVRDTDDSGDDADGPPVPRHPGWARAGRLVGLLAAAVLFLATAAGWGVQIWLDGKLGSVAALDPDTASVLDAAAQRGDQNYLLAGTSPAGANAVGADAIGQGSGIALTSVLLVHVPAKADRVVLTSLPANLTVDRPSCDRWDGTDYPGGTSPAQPGVALATSYAVGGPRCLTKAVQQLTGLSVNHYTGLDLAGVAPMIDAVHGLPICPPGATTAAADPVDGPAVLTGAQALDFVRPDGASPGSPDHLTAAPDADQPVARRQELFLTALLRKATSDQVLTHFDQLRGLVTAFGEHSLGDHAGLAELAGLATALRRVDPGKVYLVSVPIAGPPDASGNVAPATGATRALFEAIRTHAPLPGLQAGDTPGVDDGVLDATARPASRHSTPPSAVTLGVRNGSSRHGLANQAADSLRTLGFTVTSVGDASKQRGDRTVVRHSADRADQAEAVTEAVPSAVSETVPGATGLLELVLGDGFDGQVRAAPAASAGAASGGVQAGVQGGDQGAATRTLRALIGSCR
jgi:LCP family protein required for cell wall assembly